MDSSVLRYARCKCITLRGPYHKSFLSPLSVLRNVLFYATEHMVIQNTLRTLYMCSLPLNRFRASRQFALFHGSDIQQPVFLFLSKQLTTLIMPTSVWKACMVCFKFRMHTGLICNGVMMCCFIKLVVYYIHKHIYCAQWDAISTLVLLSNVTFVAINHRIQWLLQFWLYAFCQGSVTSV